MQSKSVCNEEICANACLYRINSDKNAAQQVFAGFNFHFSTSNLLVCLAVLSTKSRILSTGA